MFDLLMSAAGAAADFIKGKEEKVEPKGLTKFLILAGKDDRMHFVDDNGTCLSIYEEKERLFKQLEYIPDTAFDPINADFENLYAMSKFRDIHDFLDDMYARGYLEFEPHCYETDTGFPMLSLGYKNIIMVINRGSFYNCPRAVGLDYMSKTDIRYEDIVKFFDKKYNYDLAFNMLDKNEKKFIYAVFFKGLSVAETAAELDMNERYIYRKIKKIISEMTGVNENE